MKFNLACSLICSLLSLFSCENDSDSLSQNDQSLSMSLANKEWIVTEVRVVYKDKTSKITYKNRLFFDKREEFRSDYSHFYYDAYNKNLNYESQSSDAKWFIQNSILTIKYSDTVKRGEIRFASNEKYVYRNSELLNGTALYEEITYESVSSITDLLIDQVMEYKSETYKFSKEGILFVNEKSYGTWTKNGNRISVLTDEKLEHFYIYKFNPSVGIELYTDYGTKLIFSISKQ